MVQEPRLQACEWSKVPAPFTDREHLKPSVWAMIHEKLVLEQFWPRFGRYFQYQGFTYAEKQDFRQIGGDKKDTRTVDYYQDGGESVSNAAVPQVHEMAPTAMCKENFLKIMRAVECGFPVLLEGESGAGKTFAVEFCAMFTKNRLLRVNMSPSTSIEDLVGSLTFQPGSDKSFVYRLGPLAEAVRDGCWLLIDESNLATDEVLSVFETMLSTKQLQIASTSVMFHPKARHCLLSIPVHPNFRVFFAQNPAGDSRYGTRHVFSASLISRFVPLRFESQANDRDGLREILLKKLTYGLDAEPQMEKIMSEVANLLVTLYQAWEPTSVDSAQVNLRDLMQGAALFRQAYEKRLGCHIQAGLKLVFEQDCSENSLAKIRKMLMEKKSLLNKFEASSQQGHQPGFSVYAMLRHYKQVHNFLDLCKTSGRHGLVIGPGSCGKAAAVKHWLQTTGKTWEEVTLMSSFSAEDFFGRMVPTRDGRSVEWRDGPIVRAMEKGKVLLIRRVDEIETSVLEALNAVLEPFDPNEEHRSLLINGRQRKVLKGFLIIVTWRSEVSLITMSAALKSRLALYRFPVTNQKSMMKELVHDDSCIIPHAEREDSLKALQDSELPNLAAYAQILSSYDAFCRQSDTKNHDERRNAFQFFVESAKDRLNPSRRPSYVPFKLPTVKSAFVLSTSWRNLLDFLTSCSRCGVPAVLQGGVSMGKKAMVAALVQSLAKPFYSLSFCTNTTISDIIGSFVLSEENGRQVAKWKSGPLYLAMEKGGIFLGVKMSLSSRDVLSFVEQVLSYPQLVAREGIKEFTCPMRPGVMVQIHPNFAFIATQYPPGYQTRGASWSAQRKMTML
eukprot:g36971.t1